MLEYSIDFLDGARFHLNNNNEEGEYKVTFKDDENIIYQTNLKPGNSVKTKQIYYKNWNIIVEKNEKILLDYKIDLKDKNVLIRMQSKSLGDTLAWTPYIEEFRKKHNCKIYYSTFLNFLFKDQYPDINFINPGEKVEDVFAQYHLGWFNPMIDKNPNDYKKIPLQKTSSDILGLEYKEIIPNIIKPVVSNPYNQKYVCIAQYSTANAKHWHYPILNSEKGWQTLVDWLNYLGYKVLVISKQGTNLKNVIDRTGDYPLEWRIHELMHADFFIGLGSGLSWLAWALGKKVVMISGFSDPICEFTTNNIRIINKNVCNSCFNKFEFDKGDWNWCPIHKDTERQFECTRTITPKMISNEIIKNKLVENKEGFNFDLHINDNDINVEKMNIYYKDNRINIHYNDNENKKINIKIKDEFNKIIKNSNDVELNNNFIIWYSFDLDSDYYNIEISNDLKILYKIKLNIEK